MIALNCRLCGHLQTSVALSLPGTARNIQSLLKSEDRARDKPIDLTVRQCNRCGFVQLPPMLGDAYYDDYLMGTTHSVQMQSYQQRQAQDFVQRFELSGKNLIKGDIVSVCRDQTDIIA